MISHASELRPELPQSQGYLKENMFTTHSTDFYSKALPSGELT